MLMLVLGLAAPFLNADAFRGNIQRALEETLSRKIEIGKVHFSLFSGPGFTLDDVVIQEDNRYGIEPFAHVPALQVRVRLDKLLIGEIRLLGLRLQDPTVNLVKSHDGTWNVVALVERLGAPRRSPLNFFPAVQISNARVDFKLGVRKTNFYLLETDISIYPESSGKIYFKFQGSPARTDRAGNGFGHLTGTANWYLKPAPINGNELEADVNLQPSNLSELATLLQGQDLGVHGTVSAHVLFSGPFSNLHATGDMRLDNVHRWDLLPSPGDSWPVRFEALADLQKQVFSLTTVPLTGGENPLKLQLRASNFMTHPAWSVLATMQKAPLATLLPLGKRMGIAFPAGLQMDGSLNGVIGASNSGEANSMIVHGGVMVSDAVANIPNIPPLRSALARITIDGNRIHIDPSILQTDSGGTLRAGGNFDLATQKMDADIDVDEFSIAAFKQTTNAWFGSPQALALLTSGTLTGRFQVKFGAALPDGDQRGPVWSGQTELSDATLSLAGLAEPVEQFEGRAVFDETTFDLPKMFGVVKSLPFSGSYHYSATARHMEKLRLTFPVAGISDIESILAPTLTDSGLLSRLPFTRRSIPAWLKDRNLDGELNVAKCSFDQSELGPLGVRFLWQGTNVQISSFQLRLPGGSIAANGSIALASRLPRYRFLVSSAQYAWNAGSVSMNGAFETSGTGEAFLQHLASEWRILCGKLSTRRLNFV